MPKPLALLVALVASALSLVAPSSARAEKLRDLAEIQGARDNQLIGFGIVTGLSGTGDDQMAPIAAQSTIAMLRRLGVQVDQRQLLLRNVAAVVVTATLPPFSKPGTRVDITVSSIGNARSLSGGTLVQALLKGADQKTYAVAQGSVLVGNFKATGSTGSSVRQGTLTAGRVPQGGLIEREVKTTLVTDGKIALSLRTPSFSTAARVAEVVNKTLGDGAAEARDGGTVTVNVPKDRPDVVGLIAQLEELEVVPVRKSRVVINERNGTIVAGGDVRLAPAAVVHGNLTIVVKEAPAPSQPVVGPATVVPSSSVNVTEDRNPVRYLEGAPSLSDVAQALGALGLSTRELASVLTALRTAGALEAEIIVE
jgi:flagellar P-ring protein precursor FlgI